MVESTVAEMIAEARAKIERLGRREVCRRANLSRATLDNFHKDTWNPTAGTLKAIEAVTEESEAA